MNEAITIHVPIQIEKLGGQFVRAKPLGPWRIQAVGSSWKQVRGQLRKRLEQALPTTLPTHLFEGRFPPRFEQWETVVELTPAKRSQAWSQPILVRLQAFRWQFNADQCVVRIPAVNCTLFGKREELGPEEITRQARIALVRLAENRDLLELRERFCQRHYDFASLKLSVPVGIEPARKDERKKERSRTATLRATASDLTLAKLGPVYGIDDRVREVAQYFQGETPQSVLLVGPSGVGKTAIVHRLVALREELGLGDRKVWSTSGSRIVSGMSGLGMWQQRCSKLIRQAHDTSAIIHLGSLFELMEAGKIDGQPGVASMVRQSIARGRLLAIAECTPEQFALVEREDPMLLRGFVRFECKEPPSGQVLDILRSAAAHGSAAQGSGPAVAAAGGKTAENSNGRQGTMRVMGIASSSAPAEPLEFTEQALEELTRLHSRFATYSAMPAMPLRLMQTIREQRSDRTRIEASDVAREFAKQTGLPRFLVDDAVPIDLQLIRQTLAEQVIGQREPVELIVNLIATIKARMIRPGRPLASLMFIGPTGVGKTEMAKAIAHLLYSDAKRMIRIDMSEYSSPWSMVKLIGKPGEGDGALTSPIREQPFSVVLLDEFEKADPNVFDLLLQVLGEGRLTDSRGRWADFRNAVVIMTSNLGADSFRDANFGFGDGDITGWREHFERELRRFVRPEFLGRLDRIAPFQPLPKAIVRQIAQRELKLLSHRPGLKYSDSTVEFTDAAIDLLSVAGYEPKYGARPLRRVIEQQVAVPLADALSLLDDEDQWHFQVEVKEGKISIASERRSAHNKSSKSQMADGVNAWQQIGAMARCAESCPAVRDLENELERTVRYNDILRRKLKTVEGPSRTAALRQELHAGQQQVATAERLLRNLREVANGIQQRQLELLVRWHRNEELSWETLQTEADSWKSQLRHVIENILQGQVTNDRVASLVVSGAASEHLQALCDSYRMLAERQHWTVERFWLAPYNPNIDPDSAEYRRRVSEKKKVDPEQEPDLRLMIAGFEEHERVVVADAYRDQAESSVNFRQLSIIGFAMQLAGTGVASWLGDEEGIVHFFDAAVTGARRRMRYRIDVSNERLSKLVLPSNWPEPVGQPQRDPRKQVSLHEQTIAGANGAIVNYGQRKITEGLLDLIVLEHERALWDAIGYAGIPADAQLHNYSMDVPF